MKFGRALLLITFVALGIRVAYVTFAKSGECPVRVDGALVASYPGECAVGDQIFYNASANGLADGEGFVEPLWSVTHPGEDPPPAADHPPLTTLVLAPVSYLVERPPLAWIAGDDIDANVREHRYAMTVLGAGVVALVGLLGRRIHSDRVGLVAAGIAALTPNLWVNDGLVMSETVMNLAVVGALLAAASAIDRPSLGNTTVLGLCCGLAALARTECLLFLPLLAVPIAWRARARATALLTAVGAAVIVIAPWVGYNLARFDEPVLLSTNDGTALAGAYCDPVYSGNAIGVWVLGADRCPLLTEYPGDQSTAAKIYRDRAFDYVGDHVRRTPVVVAARVARTWSVFRPLDMVAYNEGEGRERWVTRLGLVAFYPTLLAAAAGAIVLVRRRALWQCWVLAVPVITVTITSAITYGQTRFRAAAEPSLAVLAAVALVTVWTRVRAQGSRQGETA